VDLRELVFKSLLLCIRPLSACSGHGGELRASVLINQSAWHGSHFGHTAWF
jgi:hypothetical protein